MAYHSVPAPLFEINPNWTSNLPEKSKSMKHILTGFSLISAWALLALAVGCASSTPTQSEQNMLIAAGFKTITPKTTAQQQKLQALPPGQLAQITKNGQTFYVFPDAANNRAFVGGPDQYQALVNYRLSQHLAAEQLATSTVYADPSLGWDTWNGWPGTYGHQRRVARRAARRSY
jgi:hypothetical protein